jgi:hypothetical protein
MYFVWSNKQWLFPNDRTARQERGRDCNLLVQLLLGLARAVALWSKSLITHDHILLSHMRLPQSGGGGGYSTTDGQTVSLSVCLGIEHPCGTCDQILLPVGMLLPEICNLVSVGRPLWPEDRSAVCSAITQWSESRRTRCHTLLSHLRLPQTGGPGSRIYIPQEQGGQVIPLGTGFQAPVFISPRKGVAQLYPRTIGSVFVASYDSQGYGGGILTRRHTGDWKYNTKQHNEDLYFLWWHNDLRHRWTSQPAPMVWVNRYT